jgi:hypothetical protein
MGIRPKSGTLSTVQHVSPMTAVSMPESISIFIAEDDPWYSGLLEHHLRKNPEYQVKAFKDGRSLY